MNDIDKDIQGLQRAIHAEDEKVSLNLALSLLCGFLKDVRRIADGLSSQSKGD